MELFGINVKTILTVTALAMTVLVNGYYCVMNIKVPGKRPHIVTAALLGVLTGMAGIAQVQAGAGLAAGVSLLTAGFNVVNAVTGWRKGGGKDFTLNAKICIALTIVTGGAWYLSGDPLMATILLTVAATCSYVPTIEKVWHEPESEFPNRYLTNTIRYLFATLGATTYSWATMLYPASWTVMNALVYGFICYVLARHAAIALVSHIRAASSRSIVDEYPDIDWAGYSSDRMQFGEMAEHWRLNGAYDKEPQSA